MAITIKSEREIELMAEAGKILERVHNELEKALHPGMSTKDIDTLGEKIITFMNDSVFIRNSMNNFLVHRYTDRCRVSIVIHERRNTSKLLSGNCNL